MARTLAWYAVVAAALPLFAQAPITQQRWTSSGPPYHGVPALATVKDDDPVVYAGAGYRSAGQSAIFLSRDAGEPWIKLADAPVGETVVEIAVDPRNSANMIAATRRVDDSTTLYWSSDRGTTWKHATDAGMGCGYSIVFERTANSALLACGDRLLRSDNAGISWAVIAGPANDASRLLASPDGSVLAYGNGTIYRTEKLPVPPDAGASWTFLATAPPTCPMTALAVLPDAPLNLLAGTGDIGHPGYGGCGGVFRSIDGGASWEATDLSGRYVSDIRVDPRDPSRVFASAVIGSGFFGHTLSGGVFMSEDGGQTWTDLGLPPLSESAHASASEIAISSSGRTVHAASDRVYQFRVRRPISVAPRAAGEPGASLP